MRQIQMRLSSVSSLGSTNDLEAIARHYASFVMIYGKGQKFPTISSSRAFLKHKSFISKYLAQDKKLQFLRTSSVLIGHIVQVMQQQHANHTHHIWAYHTLALAPNTTTVG